MPQAAAPSFDHRRGSGGGTATFSSAVGNSSVGGGGGGGGRSKRDREKEKEKIWQSIWGDEEEDHEAEKQEEETKQQQRQPTDASTSSAAAATPSDIEKTLSSDTVQQPGERVEVSADKGLVSSNPPTKSTKPRTSSSSSDASPAAATSLLQRMGTTPEQLAKEYQDKKTSSSTPAVTNATTSSRQEPSKPAARKIESSPQPAVAKLPASPARGSSASRWAPAAAAGSQASKWAPRQDDKGSKSNAISGSETTPTTPAELDSVDGLQEQIAKVAIEPSTSASVEPPTHSPTNDGAASEQIIDRPSTPPPRKDQSSPPDPPFTPSNAINWADEDQDDEDSEDFVKEMAAQWGIDGQSAAAAVPEVVAAPFNSRGVKSNAGPSSRKALDPITEASSKDPSPPSEPNAPVATRQHQNSRSRGQRSARPPPVGASTGGRANKVELLGPPTGTTQAAAPAPSLERARPRPVPANDAFARLSGGMLRGGRGGGGRSNGTQQRSDREAKASGAADQGGAQPPRVKGRGNVKAKDN